MGIEGLRTTGATCFQKERLKVVQLEWFVQHLIDAQVERAFHDLWC